MENNNLLDEFINSITGPLETIERAALDRWVDLIVETWENDRQIFVIGNGGSGLNASHFAEDLGKTTIPTDEPARSNFRRLRILSLTDNVGWITAIGNDQSFEDIFVEQLKNFAQANDLLIAISVSGNSQNVIKAVEWANVSGLKTFGLSGYDGGVLKSVQQEGWHFPVHNMGICEGIQLALFHWVLDRVIEKMHS